MTFLFIPNLDPSGGTAGPALEATQLLVLADTTAILADTTAILADTTSIDSKITACNTGAIAGSVTANAGTNLNTSALALETGGNLATIAGDTTSIDAKLPAQVNSTVPVTNMATDIPVAFNEKNYSEDTTSITILYKLATVLVATRVITWASAAAKTAGSLPTSNVVTLAGA